MCEVHLVHFKIEKNKDLKNKKPPSREKAVSIYIE